MADNHEQPLTNRKYGATGQLQKFYHSPQRTIQPAHRQYGALYFYQETSQHMIRYVPPAPASPTIPTNQATGAVVLERTYRQLPASAARILENTWVALGFAGEVLAAFMAVWLWQSRDQLTEQQEALRLFVIVFLVVNGIYAFVRFGLDEWIDLAHSLAQEAEIRELLAQLDERDADNDVLRTELHQAQLNLEALQRRKAAPVAPQSTPPPPQQPEPRIAVCARIILQRFRLLSAADPAPNRAKYPAEYPVISQTFCIVHTCIAAHLTYRYFKCVDFIKIQ